MNGNDLNEEYARVFGRKKKHFPWLAVSAVALLVATVILLAVFINSYAGTVHLVSSMSGTVFEDKRGGVTYVLAPMCYEPVAYYHKEVYAECGDLEFFEIRDASPKEYLCTAEYGVYDLYYSDALTLPSLEEFGANYARVYEVEDVAIQMGRLEKDDAVELVRYLLSAETCEVPRDVDTSLEVKFMSDGYPFMYYSVNYYKTEEGDRYIYDRSAGRCVMLGDILESALA